MSRPELSAEQRLTLDALLRGCQAAFGRDLIALYVYGAITFAETEDVVDLDYHVVVDRRPDANQIVRYEAAGADLARSHAPWGADLDGWVILRGQASGADQPEHVLHPGLKDGSWALHRAHWLAGHCLVLIGPDPAELVIAPTWVELKVDLLGELRFAETSEHDAYAVMNACRILHSFASKDVVQSKFGSAAWGLSNVPGQYHAAIRGAMAVYRGTATVEDVASLASGRSAWLMFVRRNAEQSNIVGRLKLRQASEADRDFARALHHACYRPWVEPIWGWDEGRQDHFFAELWEPQATTIVELDGEPVGSLRTSDRGDHIFIDDIEIHPDHQRGGLGTRLMRRVLDDADSRSLPTRLQVIKGNPAHRLYGRLGFAVTGDTETHLLMERPATG